MDKSIKKMNFALYNAALHLMEAGKFLTNVEDFRPEAVFLFKLSEDMMNIIQPEQEKVSKERMDSILDEIINFSESKK